MSAGIDIPDAFILIMSGACIVRVWAVFLELLSKGFTGSEVREIFDEKEHEL